MSEKELQELKDAYNAVFDQNGAVKGCGREKCIHLIKVMKKHTSEDVGNLKTGMMDIETVKRIYKSLVD